MNASEKSKQFMRRYFRAMHHAIQEGPEQVEEAMDVFIQDDKLKGHIRFFSKAFPGYRLILDYMMADGQNVFVKVTFSGKHAGTAPHLPATQQEVMVPFALGYRIENDKIVDFWAIANEMDFFEQLGLSREEVEIRKESLTLV